ncbi:MAG: ankyrin repeat domain-containing protein [Gemmatimonadota bacterium]|nr:ankyrin repeat domain-containing protein [Gemmatimonadota bacterium]
MSVARRRTGLRVASMAALSLMVFAGATPYESLVADAAQKGDLEAVRALLQQGADPNAAQPDGLTGLHWAALNDELGIAEILLYAGATVSPVTRVGGYTPLHLASQSGHGVVARTLLEAGADANAYTTTGVSSLHFAAQADAAEAILALIEHGAEVDARDTFSNRTPLMFAAYRGAVEATEALVRADADISATTAVKDYVEISRAASTDRARRNRIVAAAEPPEPRPERQQARGGGGNNSQRAPCVAPSLPEIRSSTEQIGQQGGFAALHFAAREGHIEAARLLLGSGANVDQVTAGDQSTALVVAAINGNYDLARTLLEADADPNLLSDDGVGPLFATLNIEWSLRTWYPQPQAFRQQQTSYLDLMELLLDAGADPNEQTQTHIWYAAYNAGRMGVDFTGATPFWRAAYAADVAAMRLLADNGADPNIWTQNLACTREPVDPDVPSNPVNDEPDPDDPSGLPAVAHGGPAVHAIHAASGVGFGTSRVAQTHRSAPNGWLSSMKYLIEELGVDPNLRDKDGLTALHNAAARGDNETILYLVSQGADVTLVGRRGQTTADLANSPEQRAQPFPQTIALLEKLGSENNHNCRTCGVGAAPN